MTPSRDISGSRDGRRRTAVMADVAKLAGVSHQTVSRVINDSAHVRPETKQRVLAAMRQLDYRPNPAARALVTGRSGTLGVVSFDTTLYGPGLDAVRDRAGRPRRGLLHHHRQPPRPRPDLGAGRRRAPARAGRRRHPRHHAAGGRRPTRWSTCPPASRWWRSRRAGPTRCRWSPSTSSPARSTPRSCCSTSATETVWHVAGPREFLEAQQRVDGWRATLEAAGARGAAGARRRLEPGARATGSASSWPGTPR